jgi:hypothetical protein
MISIDQIQTPEFEPDYVTIKRLELADSLCLGSAVESVLVSSQLEEGADAVVSPPDAARQQISVSMNGVGEFSNTVFNVTVSSSPTSYNITYTNTTNTQGVPLQYSYTSDTIKISFSLENWPWDTSEKNTHLILNFLGDLKLDSTFFLNYSENDFHSRLDLTAEQSKILMKLERGAVIDGTPFRDDRGQSDPLYYYWNTTSSIWTFQVDFRFRNYSNSISEDIFLPSNTGFYKFISYDPTFSAIFTGTEFEDLSGEPKGKVSRSTVIGASVGAILGAIFIIGILVVVVKTVPAVNNFIFPYAKRSQAAATGASSKEPQPSSSSWNRYKPT